VLTKGAQQEENMAARKTTSTTKDTKTTVEKKLEVMKPVYEGFNLWFVGDTPLITHAWSAKAKKQMLDKQQKKSKRGRPVRDPEADYLASIYKLGDGYGFPVTGLKKCVLSSAHKDKGVARTDVQRALFLDAEMVRVSTAHPGSICDMPLTRLWGSQPQMREDMVRVGSGLNKSADLSYRAQFTIWAFHVIGRYNVNVFTLETLGFLIMESGLACGLGEWRNEKNGVFGSFHLADPEEATSWTAFSEGRGELPIPESYKRAAE
jgi:hypothetical protein